MNPLTQPSLSAPPATNAGALASAMLNSEIENLAAQPAVTLAPVDVWSLRAQRSREVALLLTSAVAPGIDAALRAQRLEATVLALHQSPPLVPLALRSVPFYGEVMADLALTAHDPGVADFVRELRLYARLRECVEGGKPLDSPTVILSQVVAAQDPLLLGSVLAETLTVIARRHTTPEMVDGMTALLARVPRADVALPAAMVRSLLATTLAEELPDLLPDFMAKLDVVLNCGHDIDARPSEPWRRAGDPESGLTALERTILPHPGVTAARPSVRVEVALARTLLARGADPHGGDAATGAPGFAALVAALPEDTPGRSIALGLADEVEMAPRRRPARP